MRIFKTKTLARFTRQNDIPDPRSQIPVWLPPWSGQYAGWSMQTWVGASSNSALRGPEKAKEGAFACLSALALIVLSFCSASPKNERENIEDAELKTLREIADTFLKADEAEIEQALQGGVLIEVDYG